MRRLVILPVFLLACGCQTAQPLRDEALFLPSLFSDGMVVQQGKPVAVWGKAVPGMRVRVTMAKRKSEAEANEAGVWQAYLEPLDAGGPHELAVRAGRTKKVIRDVLVGEVWLCSGQSNMEMTMQPGPRAVLNVEQELAAANYPTMRLFTVPSATKFEPQRDCPGGRWQACTPETVKKFSAAGYFFGRDIQREINVPVGLINASRGASPAEAWTSGTALEALPEWRPIMDMLPKLVAESAKQAKDYRKNYDDWVIQLDSFDSGYSDGKAVWADPVFDTHDWVSIQAPGYWEDQGFPTLDGFAWYRKEVELPAQWTGKPLRLHLAGINDMDRAWFNGVVVGEFNGASGFTIPRDYPVPANVVHAGRNVIAVRVYDIGNNGGFVGAAADMHLDVEGAADTIPLAGAWRFKPGMDLASGPAKPVPPVYVEGNQRIPAVLYNGMIAPLVPYALRGIIWYQGESNVGRARQYETLFPALINDWRTAFRQGDLPFFFVQLASFNPRSEDANASSALAELRDAQARASRTPNTGMAVTIDIGDAENVHPPNKQEVGRRLALLALQQVYKKEVVASGPVFESARVENGAVRVQWKNADGLKTAGGAAPRGFALAGEDKSFYWATARVDGADIVLTCENVTAPRHVRYAWADNPDCNLVNGAGLPAAPFMAAIE